MRKPKGRVRPHGTGYQVIVPVGLDPITKRYNYRYGRADTEEEARALRDQMLADVAAGREPKGTGQPHFHGVRTSVLAVALSRELGLDEPMWSRPWARSARTGLPAPWRKSPTPSGRRWPPASPPPLHAGARGRRG